MLNLMEHEFSKQPVRVSKAVWSRMLVSPPPILAVKILCALLYLCDYQISWCQHRNGIILICFLILMCWIQTQCLTKKKVEMKYKEVLQVLGMTVFVLQRRPLWMRIGSLDELKTKLGHVIVMILLVKMYEKSKVVVITTSVDLLGYAISIFMSSTSLYVLHRLHHG
jgi:hypothetical protein